jgi:hypothetical protein
MKSVIFGSFNESVRVIERDITDEKHGDYDEGYRQVRAGNLEFRHHSFLSISYIRFRADERFLVAESAGYPACGDAGVPGGFDIDDRIPIMTSRPERRRPRA